MYTQSAEQTLAERAVERIRRDYALLDGVEALADTLGVSKCHLIRSVRAGTGESPGQLLKARRLEIAAALLRGRDYGVDAAARMVGFSCGNYFSKVFARAYGMPPLVYRARNKGALAPAEEKWVRELEYLYQA